MGGPPPRTRSGVPPGALARRRACQHVPPDDARVAAKVARYFPNGLDAFWGAYLVAGTPEVVAAHFQEYVDAGIEYFDVQTLDPDDEETIGLVTAHLLPLLRTLPQA